RTKRIGVSKPAAKAWDVETPANFANSSATEAVNCEARQTRSKPGCRQSTNGQGRCSTSSKQASRKASSRAGKLNEETKGTFCRARNSTAAGSQRTVAPTSRSRASAARDPAAGQ